MRKRKAGMGKKRTVLSAAGWLLCAAMLLAGCVAGEKNTNLDEQSAAGPAGIIGMEQEEESTAETGSLLYEEGLRQRLSSEQERLLLSYMDCYYASMARLSVVDVSGLFAGDAQLQARGNQAVWEYQIGVRSAQLTDLSLAAYRYTLTCIQIEEQEGAVRVEALEDSVQNFSAHPQVNSEVYGCHHIFTMKESAGAWKLTGHTQWNSLYIYMTGSGNDVDTPPGEFDDLYPLRREELLSAAEEAISRRISQNTAAPELSAEHAYDRAAAVAYAHQWADGRNHLWPDYTRYGGNCQNYVSQCLLAGGIPMDLDGSAVWKWYGDTPDNRGAAFGRSGSWSSVNQFAQYAESNTGYGLAARIDAPYYEGEPGDILDLGFGGEWQHTVLIVGTVTDEAGNTVDYLVDSNTVGQRSFPAGAYDYFQQMLIRIYGWNE